MKFLVREEREREEEEKIIGAIHVTTWWNNLDKFPTVKIVIIQHQQQVEPHGELRKKRKDEYYTYVQVKDKKKYTFFFFLFVSWSEKQQQQEFGLYATGSLIYAIFF